jgi:arginine N-succinyltransferase
MAKLTGGGFTNLPADKGTLVDKLIRSEHAFGNEAEEPGDDLFVFVLENVETGQIRGTCQVFSRVGMQQPFYSYRISTLTQTSPELGRTFRAETLTLCTDFEGCSEVGGLFLHPAERAGGLGVLLARSRYLFIRLHRERFAGKVLAELRGVIDEAGGSPFWDAIAGRFFGMSFQEADSFNGTHGTHFISDLMPRTPIYSAMLPDTARAVMGVPHPSGRAAMRMLEQEGFTGAGYIDIFDGGPTMSVPTDQIRTIREARQLTLSATSEEGGGQRMMLASGRLGSFGCCYGRVRTEPDSAVTLDPQSASLLGIAPGDNFLAAGR